MLKYRPVSSGENKSTFLLSGIWLSLVRFCSVLLAIESVSQKAFNKVAEFLPKIRPDPQCLDPTSCKLELTLAIAWSGRF